MFGVIFNSTSQILCGELLERIIFRIRKKVYVGNSPAEFFRGTPRNAYRDSEMIFRNFLTGIQVIC